jgi:hypothetical protein
MGLTYRFNDKTAANASQIVDAGGNDTDLTSIWMIVWGPRTVHGLYPKGSKAGLNREDKGKSVKETSDGGLYDVFREKFCWDVGLSVRDWRYVVRVANVDVSALRAGSVDVLANLRKGYWKLKQRSVSGGRAAIYANPEVLEALDAQITPTAATTTTTSSGNIRLTTNEADGREVMSWRGIPIRETDALRLDESRYVP